MHDENNQFDGNEEKGKWSCPIKIILATPDMDGMYVGRDDLVFSGVEVEFRGVRRMFAGPELARL